MECGPQLCLKLFTFWPGITNCLTRDAATASLGVEEAYLVPSVSYRLPRGGLLRTGFEHFPLLLHASISGGASPVNMSARNLIQHAPLK